MDGFLARFRTPLAKAQEPDGPGKSAVKVDHIPGEAPSGLDIGRAGWTMLHSIAAKYPHDAKPHVQEKMRTFLDLFVAFYPCDFCSAHMQREIKQRTELNRGKPSPLRGKLPLSEYVCQLHNSVNEMNNKPVYDCTPDSVLRRWHPMYPDIDDEDEERQFEKGLGSTRVADDETDPIKVMERLKRCEVWCPRGD